MIDEMFDRAYQDGRRELNAGLDRLFRRIGKATGNAFVVLNRIEFDAPWRAPRRKPRRA